MRGGMAVLACVLLLAGCGDRDAEPEVRLDTLTREQRDSLVGASGLPGAQGVNRARDAAEAARSRNETMDTLER